MGTGDAKITTAQYWREISALAKEIKREAKARGDEEEIGDIAHEMIDGHQWVIYTWAYPWVLMHTDNEDAIFDELGPVEATNYSQIMQQMVYFAMRQDVANALDD